MSKVKSVKATIHKFSACHAACRGVLGVAILLGTINSGLFVYPSLSRSLLSGICILILALITTSVLFRHRNVNIGLMTIYIIVWMVYIFISQFLIGAETYRLYYLISSLALIPILSFLLHNKVVEWRYVENLLLCMAILHLSVMILQGIEITDSGNTYFKIIGCNENPTQTALYLTGCLPIIIDRIKKTKQKILYGVLLLMLIAAIMYLKCRTAYIGMGVMLTVMFFANIKHTFNKASKLVKSVVLCAAFACVSIFAVYLYGQKKASTDGRLLIWKLSVEMIVGNLAGHGYGMFQRDYNLHQAEYFAKGGTVEEKLNADFIAMPYNDYIEHGVDGGLTGMLFCVFFYIVSGVRAYRQKDIAALAVVMAFVVMSLTNFVYTSIQAWLLLLCFMSKIASMDASQAKYNVRAKAIAVISLSFSLVLLCRTMKVSAAQAALTPMHARISCRTPVDNNEMFALKNKIETSELYYTDLARNMMLSEDYYSAIQELQMALKYTSSPAIIQLLATCYARTKQPDKYATTMKTMADMLPHHLLPRIALMHFYHAQKQYSMARQYAVEASNMPIKVKNDKTIRLHNKAVNYLKRYEK